MKYVGLRVSMALIALCFAQNLSYAQPSFERKKLDSLCAFLEDNNKMMGAVLLMKNRQVVYEKYLGNAIQSGKKSSERNTPSTLFRIGSITKTYTAAMVMQLVDAGKLKTTDKLSKYYPKITNADSITIAMLLNHHSGLASFTDNALLLSDATKPISKQALLDFLQNAASEFKAGTQAAYSNSNYLVLGWIIEDVTGDTYANNLRKYIADKHKLPATFTLGSIPKAYGKQNVANSYNRANPWKEEVSTHPSVPGGAGSIVATARDVGSFFYLLMTGGITTANSLNEMITLKDGFGYGMFGVPFSKKKGFAHNGKIDAFESSAVYFPKDSVTLVLLTNGLDYQLNDIAIGVLSIYFGLPYKLPEIKPKKEISYSREQLERYTGRYLHEGAKMAITVRLEGDALVAQADGQSSFPLRLVDENAFEYSSAGIEMKFAKLENNKYQSLQLTQNNLLFEFNREDLPTE